MTLASGVRAHETQGEETLEMTLARAIREHIAVGVNHKTGELVPVRHCRRAPEGCEARIRTFAKYLVQVAAAHRLDPWLLTAMAFRESGFNPFATGSKGEVGILQIHPKSPWARKLRFARDARYRSVCKRRLGACQKEIIERAAVALEKALQACDGNLRRALGAYNTGHCGGNPDYARRVLRERNVLERLGSRMPAGV